MILAIRTDSDEAYIGFWDGNTEVTAHTWMAGRQLSQELLSLLQKIRNKAGLTSYSELDRIIVFEGPGSYTGLRIGMSVANALSYTHDIPVVAAAGDDWIKEGRSLNATIGLAVPEYGGNTRVSAPKK